MKPRTHSNIARHIVNTLAIAKLEQEAPAFLAKVESKQAINSTTAVFKMKVELNKESALAKDIPLNTLQKN